MVKKVEQHATDLMRRGLEPFTSYEKLAHKKFHGQTHFLEESLNNVQLVEHYGIHRDLFGLYWAFHDFRTILARTQEKEYLFEPALRDYLNAMKTMHKGMEEIPVERAMTLFPNAMMQLEDPALVFSIGPLFSHYVALLRDYEALCPRSKELVSQLTGRKGIIVGAKHVRNIARNLNGEVIEKPPQWQDYVAQQEPKYRDAFRRIDGILQE